MGWWSTDIMGGDSPLDWECRFYEICGIEQFPEDSNERQDLPKLSLEAHLTSIILDIENSGYSDFEIGVAYQTLGVLLMKVGANMPMKLKHTILQKCLEDEWAQEDAERRTTIGNYMRAVKTYDGKTPTIIKSKGLFEVMAQSMLPTIESLEEDLKLTRQLKDGAIDVEDYEAAAHFRKNELLLISQLEELKKVKS